MTIQKQLMERSGSKCELCSSDVNLAVYEIPPVNEVSADTCVLICSTCLEQINQDEITDVNHWRCLNESMWSEFSPVQVIAWRILNRLSGETWAQDLLGQLDLDEELLKWAEATDSNEDRIPVKDSNGNLLAEGDSVTLIKDLDVKGAGFTAKRGTLVKNISLTGNPEQIEGRVSGSRIVLLTKFLKKV